MKGPFFAFLGKLDGVVEINVTLRHRQHRAGMPHPW